MIHIKRLLSMIHRQAWIQVGPRHGKHLPEQLKRLAGLPIFPGMSNGLPLSGVVSKQRIPAPIKTEYEILCCLSQSMTI